ncbi:unnamed protein product, partial [Acanthocheilonema viteae]
MDSSSIVDHIDAYFLTMSACSDDQSEIDNNSKTGMDIPRTAIDHNEGQTQRQNTKYKLGFWIYYLRCMCCYKTRRHGKHFVHREDPSLGALPLEWLNPDRTNFRTRKLG